jgi:hypothetical protein
LRCQKRHVAKGDAPWPVTSQTPYINPQPKPYSLICVIDGSVGGAVGVGEWDGERLECVVGISAHGQNGGARGSALRGRKRSFKRD